jgi:hypothetical protein
MDSPSTLLVPALLQMQLAIIVHSIFSNAPAGIALQLPITRMSPDATPDSSSGTVEKRKSHPLHGMSLFSGYLPQNDRVALRQ